MKRAILPISLGLAGLAATVWFFWWIFEGQREDVAVARAFLNHIAAEEMAEARALMTPALAIQLPTATMSQRIGQIEPWERIRFGQRSSEGFDPARETELFGVGIAVSGCESDLYIRITGWSDRPVHGGAALPAFGDGHLGATPRETHERPKRFRSPFRDCAAPEATAQKK